LSCWAFKPTRKICSTSVPQKVLAEPMLGRPRRLGRGVGGRASSLSSHEGDAMSPCREEVVRTSYPNVIGTSCRSSLRRPREV
jgi:hypothetical protein